MPLEQVICTTCNKEYEDSDSALVLECDECKDSNGATTTQFWSIDGVQQVPIFAGTYNNIEYYIAQVPLTTEDLPF